MLPDVVCIYTYTYMDLAVLLPMICAVVQLLLGLCCVSLCLRNFWLAERAEEGETPSRGSAFAVEGILQVCH